MYLVLEGGGKGQRAGAEVTGTYYVVGDGEGSQTT